MRLIDADAIRYEPMLSARGNGQYEDVMVAYKDQIDDMPTIEERKKEKSVDPIDRQAAIDAICELCACIPNPSFGKYYVNCIERTREPTCCNRIFVLRNLPSAEPETVSECPIWIKMKKEGF